MEYELESGGPPHSEEAERGVLGSLLMAPEVCGMEFGRKFKHPELFFYDLRHKCIFEAIKKLMDNKSPVDSLTVCEMLKQSKQIDSVGGMAYVVSLPDSVPSSSHFPHYLDIIHKKYILRQVMNLCIETGEGIKEGGQDPEKIMVAIDSKLTELRSNEAAVNERTMKELTATVIGKMESWMERKNGVVGLATGWRTFDMFTTGLCDGDMIVIAARPSLGKTSWSMNVVEHVALSLRQPVGVFSLEMPADSLVYRMACSRAKIDNRIPRAGAMDEKQIKMMTNAAAELSKAPIHIDDQSGLTIGQVRSRAHYMKAKYGIKLLVIDYLQLMATESNRAENRQQEVSKISGGIKMIARELNIPVIALCQLNREIEREAKPRRPRMSDLRESGSIEQDADFIGTLWCPEKPEEDSYKVRVNLAINKNRNGAADVDVEFLFDKPITRFHSISNEQS